MDPTRWNVCSKVALFTCRHAALGPDLNELTGILAAGSKQFGVTDLSVVVQCQPQPALAGYASGDTTGAFY